MKRIIIYLSHTGQFKPDFTYAHLYVAFSRVEKKGGVRLLLFGETETDKWNTVKYLVKLKPDPKVVAYYKHLANSQNAAQLTAKTHN